MQINQYIEQVEKELDEARIIELTKELCQQETMNPPGNEYLCNPIIEKVFKEIGCGEIKKYEKEEGRSNLVSFIEGEKSAEAKTVAIVGHTDVVQVRGQNWTSNPFNPLVRDGRIYARGACDNKGPFASVLEGVRIFNKITEGKFNGKIMLISAADEEKGSDSGIKYLFNEIGLKCDYALVPDGGEFNQLVYGEMGIVTLTFNSKGRSYHGSFPNKGFNAIFPLVRLLELLREFDWKSLGGNKEFDETVANFATINGGIAPNIVPDKAEMTIMWRYPMGVDADQIIEVVDKSISKVKKYYSESRIEYEKTAFSTPYISKTEGKLVESCLESAKELGYEIPEPMTIRGETVAKYIYQKGGAEVVVNGPQNGSMGLMHQPDEYVEIEALKRFAKYYAVILYKLFS